MIELRREEWAEGLRIEPGKEEGGDIEVYRRRDRTDRCEVR